jgi:broad specificity phosphatase PhoE
MRIMFIRHGKVDMPWVKKYNSRDYDQAWLDYDTYDILPIEKHLDIWPGAQVIVTGYKRTHQTAEQFLGVKDYMIVEDLLDEVPLKSFMDTNIRFNRHLLNFLGRVEWYFPMKRQPEWRRKSRERAKKAVDYIESLGDGDYVLVMHGFFMRTLGSILKRRGYKLKNQPVFAVRNLHIAEAVKKAP